MVVSHPELPFPRAFLLYKSNFIIKIVLPLNEVEFLWRTFQIPLDFLEISYTPDAN